MSPYPKSAPEKWADSKFDAVHSSSAQLANTLKRFNLPVRKIVDKGFSQLAKLPPAQLSEALASIRLFEQSLVNSDAKERDLHDSRYMLEYAFREMKLRASDDFLDTIKPEHLVEGYGLSNTQIFRNFQFMEICGYDLHDLLTLDWMTLYERTHKISDQILERVHEVCATGRTMSLEDLPVHYMKERLSEKRQVCKMRFRFLGPIYSGPSAPVGVVISSEAKIVDEAPERHELRFI